ncbi:hypothetical protein FBR05_10520 [Deltaproteobacteria bacterium PRO3]|nr:hypothetical protein [Deltaproteobacteria bacterium PRO3]
MSSSVARDRPPGAAAKAGVAPSGVPSRKRLGPRPRLAARRSSSRCRAAKPGPKTRSARRPPATNWK